MIQPLDDRLLVRRLEEKVSSSRIMLTDRDPGQFVEILAVGPGRRGSNGGRIPMGVKPGDIAMIPGVANVFPDWAAGVEFLIQEGDIAGIVELGEAN